MIEIRELGFKRLLYMSYHHIIWLTVASTILAFLYHFKIIEFQIPWVAVTVIGTAVAFYVGFKNSQSYDRLWEARKIWGAIVNDSRTWGMYVDGFIGNQFNEHQISEDEIKEIKQRLIYRQIGWLYAHRSQLLVPTPWEHISQGGQMAKFAKRYEERFGIGLFGDEETRVNLKEFLPKNEHDRLINYANTATQIVNEQSRDLKELREKNIIDSFRHVRMMDVLRSFYEHQGRNERIKKYPFPRQYANMSKYFIGIFLFLVPFSLIPEIMKMENWSFWLVIPIMVVIGYVYVMMEVIGDYSENPFQRMSNDIPMLSLCRTIEIDLREMLGETDLPPAIKSRNGILM